MVFRLGCHFALFRNRPQAGCAALRAGRASNRDSFTVLEEAGGLDVTLVERMRGWAGFRDVLVHDYITIDHRIAYAAILDELDDLVQFRTWALGKIRP